MDKGRSYAYNHVLFDKIRGTGKYLQSNTANEEATVGGYLDSFDSDGFDTGGGGGVNANGVTYVAWNWKANGSGSANTDGDMAETVTVSANTDAGFSIVTFTGDGANATVGHGLSKAPEMVIVKRRSATEGWATYHSGIASDAETDFIELHSDGAVSDSNTRWNDTAPTADVFSVGTHDSVNADDSTYVAYCFHSVDGYSKFGSYEGNGNADGTFIYTGFRPSLVITKPIDATGNWNINDSARSPDNVVDERLKPNSSDAESDSDALDFTSNGFKIRTSGTSYNQSAYTYIYIAFAEIPFKYSNANFSTQGYHADNNPP